jgi:hypothetical protein
MSSGLKFSSDSRVALSVAETNMLTAFLDAGDRGGFYMAYYAMTGNPEALLTAKVSTFSDQTGGFALASNWLMQDQYRSVAPPNNSGNINYQGIYFLSQEVAKSSLAAIKADLNTDDKRMLNDRVDFEHDGLVDQHRLFVSSFDAWVAKSNYTMFPGDFLIGTNITPLGTNATPGRDYAIPGDQFPQSAAAASEGFKASVRAALYAGALGKRQSDMTGSTVIVGPDGYKMTVGPDGRVNGVFGETRENLLGEVLQFA